MRNDDLALSLEEFGLSRYESRAYLVLLSKGALSASELAYYANLPRTKVYSTMKKLVKKRLAVIMQDKPVVCGVIAPEDAFGELVVAQENRVKGMKNIVVNLQKISDKSRKPLGADERRYLVLDPDSVLRMLKELVPTSRSTIALLMDRWGVRLISQCKDSLAMITSNLEVKALLSKECASDDVLSSLPNGMNVKIGELCTNMFIFDRSTVVLVDGGNGRGVLFRSTDAIVNICNKIFDSSWSNGKDLVHVRFAKSTLL